MGPIRVAVAGSVEALEELGILGVRLAVVYGADPRRTWYGRGPLIHASAKPGVRRILERGMAVAWGTPAEVLEQIRAVPDPIVLAVLSAVPPDFAGPYAHTPPFGARVRVLPVRSRQDLWVVNAGLGTFRLERWQHRTAPVNGRVPRSLEVESRDVERNRDVEE